MATWAGNRCQYPGTRSASESQRDWAVVGGRVLSKTGEGLGDWVVLIVPEHGFRATVSHIAAERAHRSGWVFPRKWRSRQVSDFYAKSQRFPGMLTPEFFRTRIPDAERFTLKPGEQTFNLRVDGR